ncbi:MAG: YigZ family protein [Actinomycetaceae bacterium]|nr:YigZ family protein [Arcanobacterium sp.]MDD7505029.1 YigZ family protein [Actinomycetaceae bacterium]
MSLLLAQDHLLTNEIVIKKSRFITRIQRTDSVDEARSFIESVRSHYPDARHHCTAFVIAVPGARPLLHSSDDGEPSGTAGRPILDVLTGTQIENLCCVVTRYFGGTLLGTGGLVRAYSDSARECLRGAPLLRKHLMQRAQIRLPHSNAGRFESEVRALGYTIHAVTYLSTAVEFEILGENYDPLQQHAAQLTGGSAQIHQLTPIEIEIPSGTLDL